MEGTMTPDLFGPDMVENQSNKKRAPSPTTTPVKRSDENRDEGVAERQLERLREYLEQSLADPRSEVASLGITNHLLMRMLIRLGESIDKVLEECPTESDQFNVLLQGVETAMRLARQINQFSRLRLVLSEARQGLLTLQKV